METQSFCKTVQRLVIIYAPTGGVRLEGYRSSTVQVRENRPLDVTRREIERIRFLNISYVNEQVIVAS
jgi:hypothetical protein